MNMFVLRRVPTAIAFLFAANVALILAAVVDFLLGSPFAKLRWLFYLDAETTLQAWYSSMQWFCAAVLFGLVALHAYRSQLRGLIAVSLFTLICMAFSADEIVGIHEWLGRKSDALLPEGDRRRTPLARTGIWPILIGIPVLAMLAVLVRQMRSIFVPAPRAWRHLVAGLVVMFTGALAVELMANLLDRTADPGWSLTQLAVEEFLEMVGVTFIIWSGYELLRAHGFVLHIPDVQFRARSL